MSTKAANLVDRKTKVPDLLDHRGGDLVRRQDLMLEAARRGKYSPLHFHLTNFRGPAWETDFFGIEQILGFQLPKSARIYRPWWANDNSSGHSQSMAWTMAGWKTSAVDLDDERIAFRRQSDSPLVPTLAPLHGATRSAIAAPKMGDFRQELDAQLALAHAHRRDIAVINAGQLHRAVGGYPTPFNRMTMCCKAMRERHGEGDNVLAEPPQGNGASLTISYKLPRS